MTLNREASNYWEQVKNASQQVKLTLISMLSASLVTPQNEAVAADSSEKLQTTSSRATRRTSRPRRFPSSSHRNLSITY